MNAEVHQDPFASTSVPSLSPQDLENAWFAAPRRPGRIEPSLRSPRPSVAPSSLAPAIDDPVADLWFK